MSLFYDVFSLPVHFEFCAFFTIHQNSNPPPSPHSVCSVYSLSLYYGQGWAKLV
jgi:hypothetical protein